MRDHEALLLGSKMIASRPYSVGLPGGPGCALAMIHVARHPDVAMCGRFLRVTKTEFLSMHGERPAITKPCKCLEPYALPRRVAIIDWFIHCFDEHVATNLRNEPKTIEQLADWLKLHELHYQPEPAREEAQIETKSCVPA